MPEPRTGNPLSPEPFVSPAKAPTAKRSEKGYFGGTKMPSPNKASARGTNKLETRGLPRTSIMNCKPVSWTWNKFICNPNKGYFKATVQ